MIDGINIILNPDVSEEDRKRIEEQAEHLAKLQREKNMQKTIEFTEDELVLLRRLVHSKLEYLGSVEDPRCEEWMDLEKKLSDALGNEYVGWEVFVEALMERERQEDK